jgi:hypothetical protein
MGEVLRVESRESNKNFRNGARERAAWQDNSEILHRTIFSVLVKITA